ncbi:DM13 domain-containing protein [Kribbella deserti]|uniref:DM13 domain-containing protein n=1 Tax=Kribbella deserti TaxID=1926257 RepID=A0ABV6QI62_9ACTN
MSAPSRRTVISIAAGALAVAAVIGLALFQPWRLVTDKVVDEALPGTAPISMNPSSSTPPTISVRPDATPTRPDQTASKSTPTPPRVTDPTEAPASTPVTLAKGSFITHEHDTSGTARIVQLADGSRVLRLEGLDTSDGPDLKVWLSDAAVREGKAGWHVFDDGRYENLGRLKGNKGNQNYAIPAGVDLKNFTSVSIWCDRFNVSFGAAKLVPA